jgi:drug/metabolite transporter (DMT)-like permease
MINGALYKIPHLAIGSTTATTFITSVSLIFVVIANYYFLGERINLSQGIGALIILVGIFLIAR